MQTILDMLIRIKNAYAVGQERVLMPLSKRKYETAQVLKDKGFIADMARRKKKDKKGSHAFLELKLKYTDTRLPALEDLRLMSKPSRHLYIKAKEIRPVRSGYGIMLLSTPKGIMAGDTAQKEKVGGELIAEIW